MTGSDIAEIREAIGRSYCSRTTLEPRGIDRYLVHTGFTFQDGDEIHIVLARRGDRWYLTDEAHTLMWLSYEEFNLTDTRRSALEVTLASNNVSFEDGRILVDCTGRDAGQCLMSMIQAILQTADLLYLDRTAVRNTYTEDVKRLMADALGDRCQFDKVITHNGEEYHVDVYVDSDTPLYVFSVSNTNNFKDVLITVLALGAEAKLDFTSLVFLDQNVKLGDNNKVKLNNHVDKLLYDIPVEGVNRFLVREGLLPAERPRPHHRNHPSRSFLSLAIMPSMRSLRYASSACSSDNP